MAVDPQVIELERRFVRRILDGASAIDEQLRAIALRHIVDFAGVTVAGQTTPAVRRATAALVTADSPGSRARLIGTQTSTDIGTAILINAMAGHIHDFDDDEVRLSIAHTTVPVMAAAWSVADAVGASGETVLNAYVCGVETMIRLGQTVNPAHYRYGWHATATLGVFGAAVACALILGSATDELATALRFAASMSAGLRASFGADGKPIQVAQAARNGYEAVRLAQAGLTAEPGTLFGPRGFVDLYAGDRERIPVAIDSFLAPSGLRVPGLIIKPYPCCTAAHTTIDAVLSLCQTHNLSSDRIRRLKIEMGADLPNVLVHDWPSTGLEGKFSMRYCAAAAAYFGRVGIAEFEEASLQARGVREMMKRVELIVDTDTPRPATGLARHSRVSIEIDDGRLFTAQFEYSSGSVQRPLSVDALRAKFMECASPVLGGDQAAAAHDRLYALAHITSFSAVADAFQTDASRSSL